MHQVLVLGAGNIGSVISFLLSRSNQYYVYLADNHDNNPHIKRLGNLTNYSFTILDADKTSDIADFITKYKIETVISSLPYFCNIPIAAMAADLNINYFDLTEDIQTTEAIETIAQGHTKAFVPQCGLAPGFISIIANHLMQHFTSLDTIKLRVGALPINISNALQYSLTWSTDGLINEYGNICYGVKDGKEVSLLPLEDLEEIKIDGLTYEAFNTSGGIGSLTKTYAGKTKNLSYKTIRYPGHCEKIKFLMNDLKLNEDRINLKHIIEHALPKTYQDVVLVYVSVSGLQNHQVIEETYVKKFYPKRMNELNWSAIQLTTASGLCTALDLVLKNPSQYQGYVRQEQFSYQDFISNPFGQYYA